jgi:Kef-type K+ transport system membrane component KefB
MTDFPILYDLGIILLAAAAFTLAARRLKMPTIVTYILAGLALGPATGLLQVTESVELISEVGIALLLFLVGLELSLDKIRDVGKVAVVAGIAQVSISGAGGFGLALLLGFSVVEAAFLGLALSFSSTVVVVKLLDQQKELHSTHGRIAVGILLVQDLVVIVALTFLTGLGTGTQELTAGAVLAGLGTSFGGMTILLGFALLSARYLLPPLFRWISASTEAIFIWSLCWCFLLVLGAELFHLSAEIGAFLAGVSLAQLPYNHDLTRRVHPLMNFFVAVFFVSLGVQMELEYALEHWGAALLMSAFVLVGKTVILLWLVPRAGYPVRTSFLTSVTLAQISEFSFILAALGLALGMIDEAVLSLVGVVGLVTISVSSYMILFDERLYELLERRGVLRIFTSRNERAEGGDEEPMRDHVVVVGMNALGRRLVEGLMERGERVVAVDTSPANLRDLACPTVLGNAEYLSVLEEAGIGDAKLLVSALQIEDTNLLLAYRARSFGVPASIHAFDQSLVGELRQIGAEHLIISKSAATRQVARMLQRAGVI